MRPLPVRVLRSTVLVASLLACNADRAIAPRPLRAPLSRDASADPIPLLVITEIMSDPQKVADAAGEWFEIYNAGQSSVDLQGWQVVSGPTGSERHTIASSVVVAGGGYVVLGNNTDQTANGGAPVAYSYGTSIALNNSNTDWIAIKMPDGTTIDSVSYSARDPNTGALLAAGPSFTPSTGISRVLVTGPGVDVTTIDNSTVAGNTAWQASPTDATYGLGDRGTPGTGTYTQSEGAGPITSVVVPAATVAVGGTRQLSATARDAEGRAASTTFTWGSSDPTIATVDATGLAHGVAAGSVTITVTAANGVSGTGTLTVATPVPASVSWHTDAPHQVPVGYVKPAFIDFIRDADGGDIVPPPPVTWSSSAPGIATIDQDGYITGVGVGTTFITAATANGVSKTLSFDIIAADAPTTAVYRNHLEFGTPADADPTDDVIVHKKQYVLSYNARRGGPNWVSWDLNASQFGDAPRCNCFSPDLSLPTGVYRVADIDYRNGGYDRGHMAQSEERTTTDQENASTFILSNVLPQGAENNQGPWSQFENFLNDLARQQGKEIYVIAGGTFGANPGTLKGEGKVAIPDYTWKVALIVNGGEGLAQATSFDKVQAIAVKMPNLITAGVAASSVGIRNTPWQNFQTTVDAIEGETGYDLLSLLPDAIEIPLEANDHAPAAVFAGATGFEGTPLPFSSAGSGDPDVGDVLSYAWDFGDGTTGTGASPTHTYLDNGSYTVKLTVTDRYGLTSSATATATVNNLAPVVQLAPAFGRPATAISGIPFVIDGTFADAGSADAPWRYVVSWGSGSSMTQGQTSTPSSRIRAAFTYLAAGSYTARLDVTDKDGATGSSAPLAIQVVRRPVAAFARPDVIRLDDRGNDDIEVVLLSRGDFHPSRIDPRTAAIGGVSVDERGHGGRLFYSLDDVDGDRDPDLILRFDRRALVDAGLLGPDTRELIVLADLRDGSQVEARARVHTVQRERDRSGG